MQHPANSGRLPEHGSKPPNRLFSILVATTLGLVGAVLMVSAAASLGVTHASLDGVAAAVLMGGGGAFCALGSVQALRTAVTGQPERLWPAGLLQWTAALYLLVVGVYALAWGQWVMGSLLAAVAVGCWLIPFVLRRRG